MSQANSFDKTHFIALSGNDKTIKPGDIIGDHYVLLSLLGEGGMGYVFLAEHNIIGKKYALKIVRPDRVDEASRQRFEVEARVIARLDHPNIVKIYNMGVYLKDCPYYVMDLLEGKALSEHVQEGTSFAIEELLDIFKQMALGLDYAHKKGIIHRDIKPSNIILTRQNGHYRAQIVDFGIAKIINQNIAGQTRTATGLIFGSPYYMSPEQCLGQTIDSRSDIYSLGCTLFECLSGEPPFKGQNAMQTMMMHQESPTPILRQPTSDPTLNHTLNHLIAKMTAKSPQQRHQSMQDIAHDLERALQGKSIIANAEVLALDEALEGDNPPPSYSPKRTVVVTISLACLIALISAFVIYNSAILSMLKTESQTTNKPKDQQTGADTQGSDLEPPDTAAAKALKQELSRVAPIKAKIITVKGQSKRQFEFPRQTIGTIFDSAGSHKAAGIVTVSADGPLLLFIDENDNETAFALPDTIKAIDSKLFTTLSLKAVRGYTKGDLTTNTEKISLARLNRLLSNLNNWSELNIVILNDFALNRETVQRLEDLPKLKTLWLMSPIYNAEDILQSKLFDRLLSFSIDCPSPDSIDPIIPKIVAAPHLYDFQVRKATFSGPAIEQLSQNSALKTLSLDEVLLTDEMLESLLNLKTPIINFKKMKLSESQLKTINERNLQSLTIYDIDNKDIPSLKMRYPNIKFGGHTDSYCPLPK